MDVSARQLSPIETKYNGHLFRSRLEARWAVFFDSLGIKFEYEYEGYELDDGSWYLPDFWFPKFEGSIHAEVKPIGGNFYKAKKFAETYGEKIWLCEGSPSKAIYRQYLGAEGQNVCVIPMWSSASKENRMYWMPCCFKNCGDHCRGYETIVLQNESDLELFDVNDCAGIGTAIEVARSARF